MRAGIIYLILFLLAMVGIGFIFSASGSGSMALKQCIFFALASGLYWLLQWRHPRLQSWLTMTPKRVLTAYGLTMLALLAVLVAGREINGAKRWLAIGSLAIQPTELIKVLFVLFFAFLLDATRRKFATEKWPELPALGFVGVIIVLVYLEPDFGSVVLLGGVFAGMLLVAGLPLPRLALYAAGAGLLLALTMAGADYRSRRLEAYKDPWKHRFDAGYQTTSSYEALGTGNWFGVGFRQGTHKGARLPEAHNDYILAVIGEEKGFAMLVVVIGLYVGLGYLIYRRTLRHLQGWQQLYGAGVLLMLGGAVTMNLFVVTGLLPSKGIALPMVSSGGSSLLGFMVMMALFARFADERPSQGRVP